MKNEPEDYSIDDLKKDKIEPWDGIRNYQVRNMIRDDMSVDDLAFFYHSNCTPPGIVGVIKIAKEAYPDHSSFNKKSPYYDEKSSKEKPRWFMVDVKFQKKFKNMITLEELKEKKALCDLALVKKGNRLSIMPLKEKHWNTILKMGS